MSLVDPRPFLQEIDYELLEHKWKTSKMVDEIQYAEPTFPGSRPSKQMAPMKATAEAEKQLPPDMPRPQLPHIKSRIVRLGDFIDTDALAPGPALTTCITDEDFGAHCLEYTHPEFRDKVKGGQRVIVADHAFGCGSSREVAVFALKGIGIQVVLARSFSFIFNRNMRTLGLLGFTVTDNAFYEVVADGEQIEVDVSTQTVTAGGKTFHFDLSDIERELISRKGAVEGYKLLGSDLWEQLTKPSTAAVSNVVHQPPIGVLEKELTGGENLDW